MTIQAKNIVWETDGEEATLPTTVEIPQYVANCGCEEGIECESNIESINNYLSDTFGWLVEGYDIITN